MRRPADPRIGGRPRRGAALALLVAAAALAGCERELILEGERLDPRALTRAGAPERPPDRAAPIALPAQVDHAAWTHRGGSVTHTIAHPALASAPSLVWSAPIGRPEDRRFRISADPVVADGRIFTMDAHGTVTATGSDGQTLWQRALRPDWAGRGVASGGGLALGDGRLIVGSAYGEVLALEPASGAVLWRKRLHAPVTAPPAVAGGRVFVVAADSAAWALEGATGKALWQVNGTPSAAGMVGRAAPAVSGRRVLLPFASGDLLALDRDTGVEAWRLRVAGRRLGLAGAGITDISGDPVVSGGRVYAGNRSGRLAAIDLASGAERWSAREGALGPVRPVGDSLFLISDLGELVRLEAATGRRIWGTELGRYLDAPERNRAEVVAHYGPLLAGGRLLVASNDGLLRSFDPVSGAETGRVEIPGGATTHPVVVGRTLYVVGRDGQLHAFR